MPGRSRGNVQDRRDAVESLIDRIYAVALDNASWDGFLDGARALLRSDTSDLVAHDFTQAMGELVVSKGIDPHYLSTYADHYAALNPWLARPRRAFADADIQIGEAVVPAAELETTEFYNDWLAPQRFHHRIAGIVDRQDPKILYFGLFRSKRVPGYDKDDIKICRAVAPHLQRVLRLRRLFPAFRTLDPLRDVVDRLPYGIICVDPGGTPWLINETARSILDARDGLLFDSTGIRPSAGRCGPAFRRFLGAVLAPGDDRAETRLRLPRSTQATDLVVIAIPLRGRDIFGRACDGAALFILDPERDAAISTVALQQQFNLTPAQSRFAALLAQGRTLDEAADELGIKRNTARAHLQHIFLKTGVSRQAQLVRLVLSSGLALVPSPAAGGGGTEGRPERPSPRLPN